MPKVKIDGVESEIPQRAQGRRPGRGLLFGVAALAAGSFAAQRAPAQLPSGYSGSSTLENVEGEEAYRALRAFGACYASRNTAEALSLIATEPASREETETYRRLFRREVQCLGTEENTDMRAPLPMVRGAIAEGLYRNRALLPANLALAAPAPGAQIRKLSEVARCYTAAHREQVRALVEETVPGSRQEYRMLGGMIRDFSLCLPDSARGRRFIATQLRYSFAEALYRMPAPGPVPPGRR